MKKVPVDHDKRSEADELARQIVEWLQFSPDLSIDDVGAAIDRRFGSASASQDPRPRAGLFFCRRSGDELRL